jgi:hypothetical protein
VEREDMRLRRRFIESLARLLRVPYFAQAPEVPQTLNIIVVNKSPVRRWVTVEPTAAGDWQEPGAHCRLTAISCVRELTMHVYIHDDGVCFSDEFNEFHCLDYDYDYGSRVDDQSPAA